MPTVQYKLVVFAIIVGFIALLPILFLDTWLIDNMAAKLNLIDPGSALNIQETMMAYKSRLMMAYLGSLGLVVLTAYAGGLFLSQKMVGPIFKLINHMNALAEDKDPGPFKLRDHDDFRDNLEPAVNAGIDALRGKK